jgi:biotin-dependent carboxylase-like uncharacterized protein
MNPALRILSPGASTTIQDLGRFHAYHLGVPASGALDDYAHRVANWLVGNVADCATLEMAMIGACVEILGEADIAVTGARMNLRINDEPARQWTSLRVRPGDRLELGFAKNGCRSFLAVSGGIDVPEVLGSRSTYVGGKIGGFMGRALVGGDILARGDGLPLACPRSLSWMPLYPETLALRAIAGPHDQFFRQAQERFFASTFRVTSQCNRMGCRLNGPPVERDPEAPASIVSEPVVPGNIQVPADGQPIILLKEQTIGGYTCIATVVTADLWRIAQVKPGDTVTFAPVSLEDAHRIYREWMDFLRDTEHLLVSGPLQSL